MGERAMGNNLGGSVFAGVIGGIISVACWYVVYMLVVDPNVYVAVGLSGFFGSLFANIFASKAEKIEA
jgi:hypothetical protein